MMGAWYGLAGSASRKLEPLIQSQLRRCFKLSRSARPSRQRQRFSWRIPANCRSMRIQTSISSSDSWPESARKIVAVAATALLIDEILVWKLPDNELQVKEKVTLRRILSHT